MTWHPDRIAELTARWNRGETTPEIAKHLGVSKNAIIGKAHRLKLKGRPSPIIRGGRTPKRIHRAAPKPPPVAKPTLKHPEKTYRPRVLLMTDKVTDLHGREGCRFPMWPDGAVRGDPGYGAEFCGAVRIAIQDKESAYCREHHARCYVQPKSPVQPGGE